MIDLTDIITPILRLILAAIAIFVIPYIKAKLNNEQFESLKKWVKVAVQAAEMIYSTAGSGATKKQYVIDYLNSKGYTVDTDTLNNLIEAAVLELKSS